MLKDNGFFMKSCYSSMVNNNFNTDLPEKIMSNVIQFLEKIASTSTLMNDDAWKKELANMDIDPELKLAFQNKDQPTIEKYLGTDTNLMCVLLPAEEEPSEDEPADDEPSKDAEIRKIG